MRFADRYGWLLALIITPSFWGWVSSLIIGRWLTALPAAGAGAAVGITMFAWLLHRTAVAGRESRYRRVG